MKWYPASDPRNARQMKRMQKQAQRNANRIRAGKKPKTNQHVPSGNKIGCAVAAFAAVVRMRGWM